MLPILGGLISALGSVFGGFFKTKEAGINALSNTAQAAIDLIKSKDASEEEKEKYIAQIITADSFSDSWLTRSWRPIVAISLWGMVYAIIAGWHPEFLDTPMTPTMAWIFRMAEICLCGYMPLRSVDKWVDGFLKSRMFSQIISNLTNSNTTKGGKGGLDDTFNGR